MDIYLKRLIDSTIKESLQEVGCVVIEGPKWCGKSTSARRFAKTIIELQLPATLNQYKIYAYTGDSALLKGETPLMIDEWQMIPTLWDYIRAEVDKRSGKGHFIIIGSAKPIENKERHSGVGRMKRIVMRPLSLWESKDSDGSVSLFELFSNKEYKISGRTSHNLNDIAVILCRGGWPEAVLEKNEKISLKLTINYINELVKADIVSVDGVKRNKRVAEFILEKYAKIISTYTPISKVISCEKIKDSSLDIRTIKSYINVYRKLYMIEDVEAWSPKLRSKATVRQSNKRQFVDPSLAASLLCLKPEDLIKDLNTFGLLFESLVIRDLRIYSEAIEGNVYNYRDSNGLEVDAIIHLNNGKWGAIEIKLGGEDAINAGAKNLLLLRDKIDLEDTSNPSFLAVITATGLSYRRLDGVYVIPIGCLKN